MPTIPPELSPACVAHDVSNANGVNKTTTVGSQPSNVFVAGRSLTILEEWVTALGSEKVDPLNEETGEYLELSPITKGRLRKRKGDCSTTKKGAATKRGKRVCYYYGVINTYSQFYVWSCRQALLQMLYNIT